MLPVKITPRAAAQIEAAVTWWRANRPAAPGALMVDLEKAIGVIAHQPRIGALATNPKLGGIRQLHLRRVHYVLYYRVHEIPERIEIVAFWHASRGNPPKL